LNYLQRFSGFLHLRLTTPAHRTGNVVVRGVQMRLLSILMVLACFGGGSIATAQEVGGGVKVGVSVATLSHDFSQDVDLDSRIGLVAGGFVTWTVRERFAVQLEGLYTQKGAAFSEMGVSGTTRLDYFEVPVLFVYSTSPAGSAGTSVQFFAGPSAAFRVSAKGSGAFEGETVDVDIPDEDIGRVDLGLRNINTDASDSTRVTNRAFAVLAGIRF
jgi:hypothetical protein